MQRYRRITYEDRCQIWASLKTGISKDEIAKELGFHRSTLYREVSRHWRVTGYYPRIAQRIAKRKRESIHRPNVISEELEGIIICMLMEGYSPEQVSGRLRVEGWEKVPVFQTIYNYLRSKRGRQYMPLLRRYKRTGGGRFIQRKTRHWTRKYHIDQRPIIVESRTRLGDWERDTFYAGQKKALLICVDRKSRYTKFAKAPSINSKEIAKLTNELLKNHKARTITNDNGTEFRNTEYIKKPIYYCRPRRPQERGTVENTIGVIRQHIKRGTDLDSVSNEDIAYIENLINHRPRKCLEFLTPHEVHFNKFVALVS